MNRKEAAEGIKRKIESAYGARDDYPPFKLVSFQDRPVYHAYVMKLIDEWTQE